MSQYVKTNVGSIEFVCFWLYNLNWYHVYLFVDILWASLKHLFQQLIRVAAKSSKQVLLLHQSINIKLFLIPKIFPRPILLAKEATRQVC